MTKVLTFLWAVPELRNFFFCFVGLYYHFSRIRIMWKGGREVTYKKYFASVRIHCNIESELTDTTIHDNGKASCNSPSKPAKSSMKAILFQ
jgi:hypothetical protein